MVDFNSPKVLEQDFLAVARLWSTVDGLYIWEFITALEFEWSFIRGRRNHNWTIWIYATTRVATLIVVTLNLLSIWITTQYNCTAALIVQLFVGYLAVASSSLLIVLRVYVCSPIRRFDHIPYLRHSRAQPVSRFGIGRG